MELFIFRPGEWNQRYNCSAYHTVDEWAREGHSNKLLGYVYLICGIVYMIPYIPCLFVMLKPELIKHSCYKIMFVLGLIDFITLSMNAVMTGILTIQGAVFCTYPRLIYITGSFCLALWCMACMSCGLLAFNRCVDVWRPKMMVFLFSEHRTYYWLSVPFIYFLYFLLFSNPVLYTSKAYAWFFDPYFGTQDIHIDRLQYHNYSHSANNICVIIALLFLYVFLSVSIWYKARIARSAVLSTVQRQIVMQSCTICAFNFLAATIYVYMQFFETNLVFVVVGQLMWQASHGGAAFVYFTLNKTIHRGVIELFTGGRGNRQINTISGHHGDLSRNSTT